MLAMLKVLLLPGMDGTGTLFGPLIDELGPEFDLETVPYPTDQALSYAELEPIVRSAFPESQPFVLVAESFSTPLAVLCAANRPSNLKGLILCAGFVGSPVGGWRRSVGSRLAPVVFRRPMPDIAAKWFLAGSNVTPELLAAIRSAISSVKPDVLVQRVRAILACDARAELAQVSVPILYLQAAGDRLVGRSRLEEIRQIRPQVTVERIAGPHLLLQRVPKQSAATIKAWLLTHLPEF
jgi:pimeloyl-[acyl-carrier protein] methyl ester esterase